MNEVLVLNSGTSQQPSNCSENQLTPLPLNSKTSAERSDQRKIKTYPQFQITVGSSSPTVAVKRQQSSKSQLLKVEKEGIAQPGTIHTDTELAEDESCEESVSNLFADRKVYFKDCLQQESINDQITTSLLKDYLSQIKNAPVEEKTPEFLSEKFLSNRNFKNSDNPSKILIGILSQTGHQLRPYSRDKLMNYDSSKRNPGVTQLEAMLSRQKERLQYLKRIIHVSRMEQYRNQLDDQFAISVGNLRKSADFAPYPSFFKQIKSTRCSSQCSQVRAKNNSSQGRRKGIQQVLQRRERNNSEIMTLGKMNLEGQRIKDAKSNLEKTTQKNIKIAATQTPSRHTQSMISVESEQAEIYSNKHVCKKPAEFPNSILHFHLQSSESVLVGQDQSFIPTIVTSSKPQQTKQQDFQNQFSYCHDHDSHRNQHSEIAMKIKSYKEESYQDYTSGKLQKSQNLVGALRRASMMRRINMQQATQEKLKKNTKLENLSDPLLLFQSKISHRQKIQKHSSEHRVCDRKHILHQKSTVEIAENSMISSLNRGIDQLHYNSKTTQHVSLSSDEEIEK